MIPLLALVFQGCGNESGLKRQLSPPDVLISAPTWGEEFRQGEGIIALRGLVEDATDRPQDMTATWVLETGLESPATLDDDGIASYDLSSDALEPGPHRATLNAADRDGDTGTATIEWIMLGPLGAPEVTITLPMDGAAYPEGDSVTFQGAATDTTTPAGELEFDWSSSVDGGLAGPISEGGQSILFAPALSVGTHVITLTATDGDGETGSASITVEVEPTIIIVDPGDLIFSEMMVDPEYVDDVLGEWVELYNTSGHDIDVTGYAFRDDDVDTWTLTGPLVVLSGDFLVLCADTDPATNGGIACDGGFVRESNGTGLALANGEDELVLSRPDGVDIDWLHYDDTWYEPAIGLGLDPGYFDLDANDEQTHWCDQTSVMANGETGTPGAPNDPCPSEL